VIYEIEAVLQRLKTGGNMAILLVEQYLDFASRLADYVYVMDQGTIVLEGQLDALQDADVKRYLAF
jgi:urea transport system ATP-binding protein